MQPKTEKELAILVQMACILEACAPKPGNVNLFHNFSDTSLEDYLVSALAIGPAFENAGQASIGRTILDATISTRRWVQNNTNLGMILLLAPLAKAAAGTRDMEGVRFNLTGILNGLTVEDARLAYEAIRLVQPGGLGKVSHADVSDTPGITLLQAMTLAQDRDSIAQEYATDFSITFGTGLPAMQDALLKGGNLRDAAVQAFLTILSKSPDTLITRKKGIEAARKASRLAAGVLARGGVFTRDGQAALAEMDRELRDKEHRLNPGTTADLTAAAIFLVLISRS